MLVPKQSHKSVSVAWFDITYLLTFTLVVPESLLFHVIFFNCYIHRVQRLMLSKGAKRGIERISLDFPNIFDKWLSHGVMTSIKDDTSICNLLKKTFSFRKHFGTVLTEEIRIAKFCTEVFVMPKHLMTKLNIPESSLYMSPLRAIVFFFFLNNIVELLWYGKILFFLHLYLTWGVV